MHDKDLTTRLYAFLNTAGVRLVTMDKTEYKNTVLSNDG